MFFYLQIKNVVVKKLILFSGLLFVFLSAQAQFLRQPINNYTPTEYGQEVSSYNLAVAVDDNGVVYLGTAYGILQYDGSSWRFVRVRVGAYVTSLAVLNNTVYVGSQNNFGFLQANENGKLEYQSLSEKLNGENSTFSRIWKTLVWNQSVVFQSEEKIFILTNDSIAIYKPESSFHSAFVVGDDLFVRERNKGLLQFTNNNFSLVPHGELFSDLGISAILPFENKMLVVTRENGLLKWEDNKFTKLKLDKKQEKQLIEAEIIGGIALSDGNYALNTLKNGVIILDNSLNIIAEYTDNSGMLSSEIFDIVQDQQGNLWSATQRGSSRILYSSAFSIYNQSSGLYGIVQAIGKKWSDVLIGTSVGLFVNHPVGMKTFEEVDDVNGSVWAIEETPLGLWIGTDNGLWYFDGKGYQYINQNNTSSIKYIPEKNWIISAGINGVQIIDATTKSVLKNIKEIKEDVYGIAYKIFDSANKIEIWVGNRTTCVWQLIVNPNLTYSFDLFVGSEDGLYSDWICPH